MNIDLKLHATRKSGFYIWKVLVPVWSLGLLSLKVFSYDVDNLEGQDALSCTLILSTFAMLFVISSFLPKTDFLTMVDQVVVMTLSLQVTLGFLSSLLFWLHEHRGMPELAVSIQQSGVFVFLFAFVLGNFTILGPARLDQMRTTSKFSSIGVVADAYTLGLEGIDKTPDAYFSPIGEVVLGGKQHILSKEYFFIPTSKFAAWR